MRCLNCGHTWKASAKALTCPNCSQAAMPETMAEGLWLIYKQLGSDYLQDGHKLLSVFADVAPDLKKERNLLDLFVKARGVEKLFAAKDASDEDIDRVSKEIVRDLSENWGMTESTAKKLCADYLRAATGKTPLAKSSNSSARKPAEKDSPAKKPAVKPKTDPVPGDKKPRKNADPKPVPPAPAYTPNYGKPFLISLAILAICILLLCMEVFNTLLVLTTICSGGSAISLALIMISEKIKAFTHGPNPPSGKK